MPATALDIGTHSLKVVVAKPGKKPNVLKFAEAPNTSELAYPKDESQAEKMLVVVDQLFHDYKLPKSEVHLSLPEEIVITKVIYIPPLTDAELASAIDWQAEQHIPIPLNQLSLEYQVLYRPPKKIKDKPMRVLLVGTRKSIVELYTNIFFSMGIQPKFMETQIFSIIRALGFEVDDPTTMLINIGAENTQLAVIDQTEIKLATNKKGGGTIFTRAIQQAVSNVTFEQAQEYKHSNGLQQDLLQGKIAQILLPTIDPLIQEVVKTIRFFNNEQPNSPVTRLVLTGGSSQMPGLLAYLAQLTGLEVLLAAPFATSTGNIPTDNQQAFTVCNGLLMRDK